MLFVGHTSIKKKLLKGDGNDEQSFLSSSKNAIVPGSLDELYIVNHTMFEQLSFRFKSCFNLRKLTISGCHGLEYLPPELVNLTNLSQLEISSCPDLKTLPSKIGLLRSLKHLKLSSCHNLKYLSMDTWNLSNLDRLEIYYCTQLESLPVGIGNMSRLRVLIILGCNALIEIPSELGNLIQLKELEVSNCTNLKYVVPNRLRELISLRELKISNCGRLNDLPFVELRNLNNLHKLKIPYSMITGGAKSSEYLMGKSLLPISLKELEVTDFNGCDGDLSRLFQEETPPLSKVPSFSSLYPALFWLLPQGILSFSIWSNGTIAADNKNQKLVLQLLEKYPRLGEVRIANFQFYYTNLFCDSTPSTSLGLFTKESIHMMYFNRCGRSLLCFSSPTRKATCINGEIDTVIDETRNRNKEETLVVKHQERPLPLSVWPTVLEKVKERIWIQHEKTAKTIEASVIFSLLQGPALMSRPYPK